MLLAGLIAAGAWIVLEPGMRPSQQPPTSATSAPDVTPGPSEQPARTARATAVRNPRRFIIRAFDSFRWDQRRRASGT